MKTIVCAVFAALGWYGATWSSGLWDGKDGFLWGLLSSGLFDFSVSIISGSSQQAWEGLTKGASSGGALRTGLNVAFAVLTAWVGYSVLMLGWHHWWTGFWASLLLGAPGLGVGAVVIFVSVMHFLLSIFPKSLWGKYVKQ